MSLLDNRKLLTIINILAALLLLIGVLAMPYGYYTFLRLLVTVVAVINIYYSYQNKSYAALIIGIIIALLFNPVIPVYLQKDVWMVLDIFTSLALILNVVLLKKREPAVN